MKCFSFWFVVLFYYMLCICVFYVLMGGKCIFGIYLLNRIVYNFSSVV